MTRNPPDIHPVEVDDQLLLSWPLPQPDTAGDKEERGRVLVIAGSREMPGALIVAATAALHAGAGKLTVATAASVARLVATAIPEARVIELTETAACGIHPSAVERVRELLPSVDAVLVGPGMQDEAAACDFCAALLEDMSPAALVLDAAAMGVVCGSEPRIRSFSSPTSLTPHAGELAHLTGDSKSKYPSGPRSPWAAWQASGMLWWRSRVQPRGLPRPMAAIASLWRQCRARDLGFGRCPGGSDCRARLTRSLS